MTAKKELARRELARRSYKHYVSYVNEGRWKPTRLGAYLTDTVQKFIEAETGNAYDVLAISIPPQHGKSMSITEALPSWYLGKNPYHRVIEISYNEDYAKRFGRANKLKAERFWENLFGIGLAKTPCLDTDFKVNNNVGGMVSRGVLSGVTGQACELMLIDDPVKNQKEADSPTYRESVFNEWNSSFKTRLAAGAKVIIIATRWHEDDLIGRLIDSEPNITVVNIPCEAEENDPLGRKIGEALCPEIGKGDDWLKGYKASYQTASGSRAWNALFQGRPTNAEGNLIKREWWQRYKTLPKMARTVISVDAAFKANPDSDYVAIQVWGKINADMYLIDAIKARMDFPQTVQKIKDIKSKYPQAQAIFIEDKANGSAIVQVLRRQISGVVAINPEGGKIARVNAVSPAIEAGNVLIPEDAEWVHDFVEECSAFPNGKHDDQVDAMSQALNRLLYFYAEIPEKKEPTYNFEFERPKPDLIGRGAKERVI